jgi:phage portal protein BeeE
MRKQSLIASRLQTKRSTPLLSSQNFQLINGRLVTIADNQLNYIQKGYDINDIVYSIITMIMDKIRVAPWAVYKVENEQAMKSLHNLIRRGKWEAKDFIVARDLRHKALSEVKNPGKWGDLLEYPNEYETFQDFVANGCGYKLLVGNDYVWADMLQAGANKGLPNSLWCLPAQFTHIKATDSFPTKVTGYVVNLWGEADYTPEEILHTKYWNPNWNINGQQLYGVAPLKAGLKILNRNNSSLDASTASFQNEGIKGILHMKNQIHDSDGDAVLQQVRELKKTMVSEWVGEINKGKMGLSGYDMGWLPIGLSSEDMQQIENEKWDMRRICNLFHIQSQMLNDPENKTYNSLEEAEVALTTRCALPALISFRNDLNRKGKKDWGMKPGYIVDFDMSAYSELQADSKEMVGWLTPLMDRGLPLNRALELLNLEKIDNPYYDEPRVTMAMGQTLEEHEITEVENALNEEEDITPDNSGKAGDK